MIIELGDEEETSSRTESGAPANGAHANNGKSSKKVGAPKAGKKVAKGSREKADDKEAKAVKREAKAEKRAEKADDAEKAARKAAEKAEKEAKKAAKAKKKAEKAKKKAAREAEKRAEKEAKQAAKAARAAADERDADDKKRKLSFESFLGRDEAVAYFEQVLAGLSDGSVELRQGENGLSLSPGAEVGFELVASQKGKKEKLSIEFSWRAEKGDADLSIES